MGLMHHLIVEDPLSSSDSESQMSSWILLDDRTDGH